MNINYVGQLQEYCQKNGLAMPIYNISRVSGPSHMPNIEATVVAAGYTIISDSYKNSKLAKQAAAQLVLTNILNKEPITPKSTKVTYKNNITTFVDMENVPNFFKCLPDCMNDMDIHGIVSTNHPLSITKENDDRIHVVNSAAPNAADTAMILLIGSIVMKGEHRSNCCIVTMDDNFSLGLIDCLETGFIPNTFNNIYLARSYNDFLNVISS